MRLCRRCLLLGLHKKSLNAVAKGTNFASGSLNGSASSLSTPVDIWPGPDAL